jgi:hypothetical protein
MPLSRMRDWTHGDVPELAGKARVVEVGMKDRRHVRVDGWCRRCDGGGIAAFTHVDVDGAGWVGEVGFDAAARQVLTLVARYVADAVSAREVELEQGRGCEAAAARQFEAGRLAVVESDMWLAVGLDPPPREVS